MCFRRFELTTDVVKDFFECATAYLHNLLAPIRIHASNRTLIIFANRRCSNPHYKLKETVKDIGVWACDVITAEVEYVTIT